MCGDTKGDDVNWVKARFECTLEKMFEKIKDAVEQDLEEFKRLDPARSEELKIVQEPTDPNSFSIGRPPREYAMSADYVTYTNAGLTISVDRNKGQTRTHLMLLLVQLTDEGKCMLLRDDPDEPEEIEIWQVNLKVLEPLFFGG